MASDDKPVSGEEMRESEARIWARTVPHAMAHVALMTAAELLVRAERRIKELEHAALASWRFGCPRCLENTVFRVECAGCGFVNTDHPGGGDE